MSDTTKKPRTRRTQKVEVPGQDEKPAEPTPVDQVVVGTAEAAAQTAISDDLAEQIVEEAKRGNVKVYGKPMPEIGDEWAGMTLTADGWVATDALKG